MPELDGTLTDAFGVFCGALLEGLSIPVVEDGSSFLRDLVTILHCAGCDDSGIGNLASSRSVVDERCRITDTLPIIAGL